MSEKNDGGPAFPVAETDRQHYAPGMALRDWFAGMALQGIVANPDISEAAAKAKVSTENFRRSIAESAYRTADAMIQERGE